MLKNKTLKNEMLQKIHHLSFKSVRGFEKELIIELMKQTNPCFSHYINWSYNSGNPILIFDDVSSELGELKC